LSVRRPATLHTVLKAVEHARHVLDNPHPYRKQVPSLALRGKDAVSQIWRGLRFSRRDRRLRHMRTTLERKTLGSNQAICPPAVAGARQPRPKAGPVGC
jgi:hypothetical protein